jgi:hypothetical protein
MYRGADDALIRQERRDGGTVRRFVGEKPTSV